VEQAVVVVLGVLLMGASILALGVVRVVVVVIQPQHLVLIQTLPTHSLSVQAGPQVTGEAEVRGYPVLVLREVMGAAQHSILRL
jgi:hypothetical protein